MCTADHETNSVSKASFRAGAVSGAALPHGPSYCVAFAEERKRQLPAAPHGRVGRSEGPISPCFTPLATLCSS
ncbi:hypothetical protein SKAU_G00349960 [Synaphobranchus kaupii]|uniref:Uncharacterized protein n=1 Tax=Synaphobranchus kaupii TaxID=118154 RepID=A0A9Q1IFX4_SYNKA|nr:hypothetical protein SKAU_G00349960 [Synaphobranchus kaupii]